MLKQLTITLDTSDPLQAQLLVEYFAAEDRTRFGRCCLLLGYLAATGQIPTGTHSEDPALASAASPAANEAPAVRRAGVLGGGLFGLE